MTDRNIDVILLVIHFGNGKQRGDWAALHNVNPIVIGSLFSQTPFDILRTSQMFFNLSAETFKLHDLFIAQRLDILPPGINYLFPCSSIFRRENGDLFCRYFLLNNNTVTHFVNISVDDAGNERLSQSEAGVDRGFFSVTSNWIGCEQDSRYVWEYHFLNDDR